MRCFISSCSLNFIDFNIKYDVNCRFLWAPFFRWRRISSSPTLLSFFLQWIDTEFYQMPFVHLLKWSCNLSFILLMWSITMIDFLMLQLLYTTSRIYVSCSWYVVYYWIWLCTCLSTSYASFTRNWPVIFLPCNTLPMIFILKMGIISFLLSSRRDFGSWGYFFLNVWSNIPVYPSEPKVFFVLKWNCGFTFFNRWECSECLPVFMLVLETGPA